MLISVGLKLREIHPKGSRLGPNRNLSRAISGDEAFDKFQFSLNSQTQSFFWLIRLISKTLFVIFYHQQVDNEKSSLKALLYHHIGVFGGFHHFCKEFVDMINNDLDSFNPISTGHVFTGIAPGGRGEGCFHPHPVTIAIG